MATRAVLFDFDGVLVPTERVCAQVHTETVERFGGKAPLGFYGAIKGVGKPHELVRRAFIQVSGINVSEDEYSATFREIFQKHLERMEATPGIPEILGQLRAEGYELGVVSSSSRKEVLSILSRLRILDYFAAVIGGDEVKAKKPAPDPYRVALGRLGVSFFQAVAVEDSESGIQSACAAGLGVIGVRHADNHNHDFGEAEEISSFKDQRTVISLIERRLSQARKRGWTPGKEINPETAEIATWSNKEIIRYRTHELLNVYAALVDAAPRLEAAAECIVKCVRKGGRVITIGAGGSGVAGMSVMRELPQNHSDIDPRQFMYCIAGGTKIFEALGCEELEDSWEEGRRDVDALHLSPKDVLICISATGRTPYTRAAAQRARELGAYTIGILCMADAEMEDEVDLPVVIDAGPEMFMGATCEKAASAQKDALDAIMDVVVVRLGLIEGNRCRARLCHEKARMRQSFFDTFG